MQINHKTVNMLSAHEINLECLRQELVWARVKNDIKAIKKIENEIDYLNKLPISA